MAELPARSGRPRLAVPEVAMAQADILVRAFRDGDSVRALEAARTLQDAPGYADVLVALANELDELALERIPVVTSLQWREGTHPQTAALGNTVISYVHSRYAADREAIDTAVAQAGGQVAWMAIAALARTLAELRA